MSSPREHDTDQPPLLLWQTNGRPRHLHRASRQKLVTVGMMYLSFTVIGIAWNRFVDPRYDWTLVLVFIGVLICFALILKRQQREMRKRLVRLKKI